MGNARSGRRPSLERRLRDAGMDARLTQEACRVAATSHRDLAARLAAIYAQAERTQVSIDDALAELRRSQMAAVPAPPALPEAA